MTTMTTAAVAESEATSETIAVRVRRETAEALRRRAGGDDLAGVAGQLLDESLAAEDPEDPEARRRRAWALHQKRLEMMAPVYARLQAEGVTDEELAAEAREALREVRAERDAAAGRGGA